MGKRDTKAAKAKRAERRGKGAAKTEAKTEIAQGKQARRDANAKDEEDLDAVLKEFSAMQAQLTAINEEVAPPPSKRCNGSLTAHPTKDELIYFGGEHFDGKRNIFYAELYRYIVKRNEWRRVSSPTAPPPRSSHQVVAVPTGGGQLFMFGGEFSSTNQQQFHHYRDFWSLDLSTWAWEQVPAKNGPSARSGHRMAVVRDKILCFGGFFDNLREVRYFNDLHAFDLGLFKWSRITPQPGAPVPQPRSGFQLCAEGSGMLLYGGYFKKKVTMQQFDSHKSKDQVEELCETGVEFRDLWHFDLEAMEWSQPKKSGAPPSSRSGFGMALHRRRLIVFGGVHDEDTPDGEGLVSRFYNDLHTYSLDASKWYEQELVARKQPKPGKKDKDAANANAENGGGAAAAADDEDAALAGLLLDTGGRRRNRNRQGGEEGDAPPTGKGEAPAADGAAAAAASASAAAEDGGAKAGDAAPAAAPAAAASEAEAAPPPMPLPRMNAQVALRNNSLYVYGGLYEPEEASEITLNDLWVLDCAKMDGWSCLFEGEAPELAVVKEDISDDDSDDDDDDEEESDDESDDDSGDDSKKPVDLD